MPAPSILSTCTELKFALLPVIDKRHKLSVMQNKNKLEGFISPDIFTFY